MISKASLRQTYLDRRMKILPEARESCSGRAYDIFFKNVKIPSGAIVSGYWPVHAEMNDLSILKELRRRGHVTALPRVAGKGDPLEFFPWDETTPMAAGKFDIAEPAAGKAVKPDVLIVPLLAFDAERHRLGYGAGFYDRTIKGLRSVLTIGLAYEDQLCDKLPSEAHDVRMDMIVTDKKVYT